MSEQPTTLLGISIGHVQVVALLAAIAWGATIWWVNGLPAEDLPRVGWSSRIPHFDKVVHFGMYGILSGFVWMATALGARAGSRRWMLWGAVTIALPVIIGALDEWRQINVPGRVASLDDWAANAAGAIVAVVILSALHLAWIRRFPTTKKEARDRDDDLRAEVLQGQASRDV